MDDKQLYKEANIQQINIGVKNSDIIGKKYMVLSDVDIKRAIAAKRIVIKPSPNFEKQLGSCSIDFRLGRKFRIFEYSKHFLIDTKKKKIASEVTREVTVARGEPFIIHPGDFALAMTHEWLTIAPDLLGRLEGRSSLGRLGIVVHSTASVFDPGWDGHPVLEIGNMGRIPVALYPGMRICAMTFEELSSPSERPYTRKKGAKYVSQDGPLESRIVAET